MRFVLYPWGRLPSPYQSVIYEYFIKITELTYDIAENRNMMREKRKIDRSDGHNSPIVEQSFPVWNSTASSPMMLYGVLPDLASK